MKNQTTIELKGKQFSFYRTNRGQFDYENAGFTNADIANGKMSAMFAFIYYTAKACAKRAGDNWPYKSLDEFIDDTDETILTVFTRLKEASEPTKTNEKKDEENLDATKAGDDEGNAQAAVN